MMKGEETVIRVCNIRGEKMTKLQIFSLVALLIYFLILLFTVMKQKRNDSVLDYFFAGRKLPYWALSITFIASWWGAVSALSTVDLAYEDGLGAFWYYGVPVLISTLLMVLGSKVIRRLGYLTQGEMMKARYSAGTAKVLSVLILLFMVVTAASQMVGIGKFLGSYMNLRYEWAVLLGTGIVLVYSLFGGFRGVVLTDIIQFVLLIGSVIIVFMAALRASGGFAEIRYAADMAGKPDYFNITAGASKYITYVITYGCAWMIQANAWQRISAAKDEKDARKMTVMSFFIYIPLYLIVVLTGMAGIAIFDQLPDSGIVTAITTRFLPPLSGALVFVGISAAIMSTMDSLINTGAMTLAIDLYPEKHSEKEKLRFSRLATLIVTLLALLIALRIRSILQVSWVASDLITTGVFVPLIAGTVWRRGNSRGAMASMIAGFLYCTYNILIGLGIRLPAFWAPESPTQVLLGMGISLVVYVTASLLTKAEYEKADAFIARAGKRSDENK